MESNQKTGGYYGEVISLECDTGYVDYFHNIYVFFIRLLPDQRNNTFFKANCI